MSTDTAPAARPIKAVAKIPTSDRFHHVCSELARAYERGETGEADVLEFIAKRRETTEHQPVPMPFRLIARELGDVTRVDVTHEAVRRWHRSAEALEAQKAAA